MTEVSESCISLVLHVIQPGMTQCKSVEKDYRDLKRKECKPRTVFSLGHHSH